KILEAAGGNPLFLEEMLSMLIDHGLLRLENGIWHPARTLTEVPTPPTIQALLGARLDLLPPREQAVLQAASVEGAVFHCGALAELSADLAPADLDEVVSALVQKELVRPHRASFSGDAAYAFRHVLIRDAAYAGLTKSMRADLHERLGGWIERRAGERIREYEERLGYHLEQAYRSRTQ